jgi:hypothetical protein
MKKTTDQIKSSMIDWMLSIDFDPVEIIRVRRDMPTEYASLLDEKATRPQRGD